MTTIKKIAEIVGLSPTTVSNVIHGKKNKVSNDNYEKIQRALKDNNYVSNMGGRLLSRRGSKIIAVIITYSRRSEANAISDPFYNQIVGYLEEEIRKNGYFMMLYTSASVEESLRLAAAWDIEGLIVLGSLPSDTKRFLKQKKLPLVFVDTYLDEDQQTSDFINVGLEDFKGEYTITDYLINLGHRKIAFFADGSDLLGVDLLRFAGFQQALTDSHLSFDKSDFYGLDFRVKYRHQFLVDIAKNKLSKYTALVFTSDYLAADAMNLFSDLGFVIPKDFSVVGFDDNILSEQVRPKLTTVHQDVKKKAVLAADFLFKKIRGELTKTPVNELISFDLVIRDSTRPMK